MKLLSRKEIKNQQTDDLEKAQKITQFVSDKSRELNDFKREIEDKKKVILEDYISFAKKIAGEKESLEEGLDTTENKKTQAFDSLARLSVDAEGKYRKAIEIEEQIALSSKDLSEREEKLEKTIKQVDERELMINQRAKEVFERAEIVINAEGQLEHLKRQTHLELDKREEKTKKREQAIDDRLGELTLAAEALKKNVELLDEREKQFKETMAIEKTQLADGRATLERAWSELRSIKK